MGIRIKAEIPLVSDDRNLLQTQSSLIQQNADNILLRVAQSDFNGTNLVSLINLAPDTVKIQAKNIDISGLVTITNFTYANLGGTKPPADADRTSTVIDGGLITTGTIQVGSGSTVRAGMRGGGTANNEVRFWAGETLANRNIAPFRVTQDGNLVATNANLTGVINSTSGVIGGFSIGANTLSAGTTNATSVGMGSARSDNIAFYAGNLTPTSAPFRVTRDGQLFATNANLTGTITANSGSIGRFAISGQDLVYTSELFDKDYDRSDVNKLHRIILGFEPQTAYDLAVYDFDNTGTLDIFDLFTLDRFVQGIGSLPTPRKRIRSVVRIGTNNGAITTQALAENGSVGPTTTIRGEKITTDLISAKAISTSSLSTTSIIIGGNTYSLTRDSNGFLKAT